jgi:two-component system, sporulation sensor kinase B
MVKNTCKIFISAILDGEIMEITKHLFMNLSILILFLFFYLVWLEKSRRFTISKPTLILLFVLMLWYCIHFSYNPISSARYDLRGIPVVIGGLYYGIGPLLVLIAIIFRSFYGWDIGFLETVLLYIPLGIAIWRLHSWFWRQNPNRRILIAICFGIIFGVLTFGGMELTYSPPSWLDGWFAYLVIPPLGIAIISYSIEFVKKNTEMKQQLIKAEKLKAVEQMGAAISHEIRNPLTAASGFVQLLQDNHLTRQKQREYLSIVKEELNSAERVIQDYLTFAKPSFVTNEELNVKSELRQIINIIQPIANQNSVEILTDFAVIGFIKGERQKFRQCFINVLKNAVESMPNGGQLSISSEFSQDFLTIKVKDTGVGMTKEQLDRLGEPFYSTKGSKGTGLGMMVVHSIVRAMDGTIWAESEPGKGTIFYFEFPTIKPFLKND